MPPFSHLQPSCSSTPAAAAYPGLAPANRAVHLCACRCSRHYACNMFKNSIRWAPLHPVAPDLGHTQQQPLAHARIVLKQCSSSGQGPPRLLHSKASSGLLPCMLPGNCSGPLHTC